MTKIWTPPPLLPPCLHLFDFGDHPPPPSFCESSQIYINLLLQSASINATENVPPNLNVPNVPQNANSTIGQNFDWVNYMRNLGSLLPFSGLQYYKWQNLAWKHLSFERTFNNQFNINYCNKTSKETNQSSRYLEAATESHKGILSFLS